MKIVANMVYIYLIWYSAGPVTGLCLWLMCALLMLLEVTPLRSALRICKQFNNPYFDYMLNIVETWGGTVEKWQVQRKKEIGVWNAIMCSSNCAIGQLVSNSWVLSVFPPTPLPSFSSLCCNFCHLAQGLRQRVKSILSWRLNSCESVWG
jgi:hypothetical protein